MIAWIRVTRDVWVRRVLRLLGIIVLGALGSGLWEYVLRPALKSLSFWILDIASLGLRNFRGDLYMQVATCSPTIASIENLNLLTFLYSALLALWLISLFSRLTKVREKNRTLLSQLENDLSGNEAHVKTLEELNDEHVKVLGGLKKEAEGLGRSIYRTARSFYVTACLIAVMVLVHTVNFSRIRYINSATVHYQQTLKIAYPYMSDDNRRRIESEFAQVRSREDFLRVVGKLESVARDNRQWVPPFEAW